MKNWEQVKEAYIKDHEAKPLKAPAIRLNALKNIEEAIRQYNYKLLEQDMVFRKYSKEGFLDLYTKLKGKPLNGAEKSVIHGLYKFSV
jgi:hypothetical protein